MKRINTTYANRGVSSEYVSFEKSKYKSVYIIHYHNKLRYQAVLTIDGVKFNRFFDDEKEAAKAVDIFRIRSGLKPVNILKVKQIKMAA